jgi:transposase
MGTAARLREAVTAAQLCALAKQSGDAAQTRRLPALAAIGDGGSRSAAAKIGGVGLQTVRDWVLAFNAAGPPGLIDGKAPGKARLLDAEKRQALARIVDEGPIPAAHGVVRWRRVDPAQWVLDQFTILISKQTLSREWRALGFRKLSARPRHYAQDGAAVATFNKTSSPAWTRSPGGRRRASR